MKRNLSRPLLAPPLGAGLDPSLQTSQHRSNVNRVECQTMDVHIVGVTVVCNMAPPSAKLPR